MIPISVCYDGNVTPSDSSGQRGGVLKYWARLIENLPPTVQAYVSSRGRGGGSWPSNVREPFFPHFRPHRLGLACEDLAAHLAERNSPFRLVHPTYYELGRLSLRLKNRGTPLVLTVFDLIQEKFIGNADRLIATGAKKRAIEQADLLVCISQSTASDLEAIHGIERSRIRVIYPGNDLSFQPGPQVQGNEPAYFLVVGQRSGYKNFQTTAKAFAMIADSWAGLQLRLSGPPISPEESEVLSRLGILDRVQSMGRLTEHELAAAYARSMGLVYPSLIEGFGFPIVEAMACGTPVITSNCSSLKEVAGDAALLVDPENPEEIAVAMERLLAHSSLRTELIAKGRLRAQKFGWEQSARQLAEAYQQLLA